MHTITISGDTYHVPGSWNELSGEQLLGLCRLSGMELQPFEFRTMALLLLLGLTMDKRPAAKISGDDYFYLRTSKQRVYMITAQNVLYMTRCLKWLFRKTEDAEGNVSYHLSGKLTRNLLPEVSVKGVTYYGPDDALTNSIYREYVHCETFLDRLSTTDNPEFLHKLIAVLYRPAGSIGRQHPEFKGDVREELNDFHIDSRARKLSALPAETKTAIMLFYSGCREYLVYKYPNVFSAASGGSSGKSNVFQSHLNIMNALGNNDVTKIEEIGNTKLHLVMNTMEQLRKQAIELESKYPKK
jgi:hypothetical protein